VGVIYGAQNGKAEGFLLVTEVIRGRIIPSELLLLLGLVCSKHLTQMRRGSSLPQAGVRTQKASYFSLGRRTMPANILLLSLLFLWQPEEENTLGFACKLV